MKVGIVTTFDELNFGAFLQAYSLLKYIDSMKHDVELINYKSAKYRKAEFIATYFKRDPIYLSKILKKTIKFKTEIKKLDVSKKYSNIKAIDDAGYHYIIFGSDEIWNLQNCLGGVVDTYYFGAGIKTKKISYAASFGSTSTISSSHSEIIDSLKEFKAISVRDVNSQNLIQGINIKDSTIVLDPTFLIDQEYIKPQARKKYIFYYCVGKNELLDAELIEFAKLHDLEIIAFGYKHKKFKNIIGISPFEWLGYLKYSEYVVTNMYHGTIFSIKYRKKNIIELTPYRANKLGYLLDLLSLNTRIFVPGKLKHTLPSDIQYDSVFAVVEDMKKVSQSYLDSALSL